MKHKIFKTLLAVVAATMTFCAEADTEIVDGIKWYYTVYEDDGEASVGDEFQRAIPESTSGAITIPSTLGGYPVTHIGEFAFNRCSSLTSVTIPDSVTSINRRAFSGCSSLTSVTIPNSVTMIGEGAFSGCSSLTSVTIPNSVRIIPDYMFNRCSSLTSVTIPNSVREICSSAFANCSSLTSVTIPGSVTDIGGEAFKNCSSLTSVTIPDSVTAIGSDAFEKCGELTIYTDAGNSDRLRRKLKFVGANVKEIIEQGTGEQRSRASYGWYYGFAVLILVGLLFWIVRRKKNREGGSDKADGSV